MATSVEIFPSKRPFSATFKAVLIAVDKPKSFKTKRFGVQEWF